MRDARQLDAEEKDWRARMSLKGGTPMADPKRTRLSRSRRLVEQLLLVKWTERPFPSPSGSIRPIQCPVRYGAVKLESERARL